MPRLLCLLLLFALLVGCRETVQPVEHDAAAAMACVPESALYVPDGAGGLQKLTKRLPVEQNMGQGLLALLPDTVCAGCICSLSGGTAAVDVKGFRAKESEALETAAVGAIVNTLLGLPGVEAVCLTFDGERILSLPRGTAVGDPFTQPLTLPK